MSDCAAARRARLSRRSRQYFSSFAASVAPRRRRALLPAAGVGLSPVPDAGVAAGAGCGGGAGASPPSAPAQRVVGIDLPLPLDGLAPRLFGACDVGQALRRERRRQGEHEAAPMRSSLTIRTDLSAASQSVLHYLISCHDSTRTSWTSGGRRHRGEPSLRGHCARRRRRMPRRGGRRCRRPGLQRRRHRSSGSPSVSADRRPPTR